MSTNTLKQYGQPLVYRLIHPFILLLLRFKVSPNTITTFGFLLNIAVAVIFIIGAGAERTNLSYLGWGGAMILFAGLFDMIDGFRPILRVGYVFGYLLLFGSTKLFFKFALCLYCHDWLYYGKLCACPCRRFGYNLQRWVNATPRTHFNHRYFCHSL